MARASPAGQTELDPHCPSHRVPAQQGVQGLGTGFFFRFFLEEKGNISLFFFYFSCCTS